MIGIDIVKIERLEKKDDAFRNGVFTKKELEYAKTTDTLAGIFAAKEAVVKALGTGFSGIKPNQIEILHTENGRPFTQFKGKNIQISITHDGGLAVAVAIIL